MSKATVVYQGGQSTYNFPFDYLAKVFVKVDYIKLDGTVQTLNYSTDYTVVDKSIVCTTISAATDRVKIYRQTTTDRIVTFVDSSILRAKDLNALDVQLLHINEESMDRVEDAGLVKDIADGKWNAKQAVIKNVADGTSQYDAVNRGQLDTIAGSTSVAVASASAARQSELNASNSAASALASANNAATSSSAAHAAELNAASSYSLVAVQATNASNSASAAELSKNQTAALKADTQVLRDDTKVMHDEVMTATPSRCLPLSGGTMGVGQADTNIINGGTGSLFLFGAPPVNKPLTTVVSPRYFGLYDTKYDATPFSYNADTNVMLLGRTSSAVIIDGEVHGNFKFSAGDHTLGTPNQVLYFSNEGLTGYDVLNQRQWLAYNAASKGCAIGVSGGWTTVNSAMQVAGDIWFQGTADRVIGLGRCGLYFTGTGDGGFSFYDAVKAMQAIAYNPTASTLTLGSGGLGTGAIKVLAQNINVASSTENDNVVVPLNALRTQTRPQFLWSGYSSGTSFSIAVGWTIFNFIVISWVNPTGNSAGTSIIGVNMLNGNSNPSNYRVWCHAAEQGISDDIWIAPNPSNTGALTFGLGNANTHICKIEGLFY